MDTKTGMTVVEGARRLAELCEALTVLRASNAASVRLQLEQDGYASDPLASRWGKTTLVSRTKLIELLVAEEQHVGATLARLLRGHYE